MSDPVFGRAYPDGEEPGPLWPHDPRPRPGVVLGFTGPDLFVIAVAVAMVILVAVTS